MLNTLKRIWAFSADRHKDLLWALGFSFLRSGFAVTQLFAVLLTLRVLTGSADPTAAIWKIVGLTALCIGGNFATSYFEQLRTLKTGFYMVADQRVSAAGHLRRVPLGFFNQSSVGAITATLTTTLSGVESAAAMVMVGIVSGLFNAFAMFLFMMFYDWRAGLLSGAGMVCYLLVVAWQMKVSRANAPALQKAQNRLAEAALTFLQGIKVTKAFSFDRGDQALLDAIRGSCDGNIDLTSTSMPSQFAAHLVIAVFESLIFLLALLLPDLELVHRILLLVFSFLVYGALHQAGSMLSMIGLLDTGLQEAEAIGKTEQLSVREPAQKAESNEISFKNVSFSYGDRPILTHVSCTMKPGTTTALVGPSGSGKTTLCQLIPRFRDVDGGAITIGGADVRNLPEQALWSRISMVFQNVYLFEDTILNNIRFGRPDASLAQVKKAARAAQCDKFIESLPQGYDTLVEEGGSNLSGGEKQRISIARAILKDAPIILLDEATSALDAENEHEVLAALEALTRDKTVLMIAHRLKTVEHADQILVLNQGKIVQRGTHRELVRAPGLYRDFVHAREEAQGWKLGED